MLSWTSLTSCKSAIFPVYFSSVFAQVRSPPILNFYMPPLAPLPPFDRENIPQSTYFTKPVRRPQPPEQPPNPAKFSFDSQRRPFPSSRRPSHSFSPLAPLSLPLPPSSVSSPIEPPSFLPRIGSVSSLSSSHRSSSNHSTSILTSIDSITAADSLTTSPTSAAASHASLNGLNTGSETFAGYGQGGELTTHIGVVEEAYKIIQMDNLLNNDHHSLYVHLFHAVQMVHACKERMWEELLELVLRGDESLRDFGWTKEEDWTEAGSKRKFKKLWEQFD